MIFTAFNLFMWLMFVGIIVSAGMMKSPIYKRFSTGDMLRSFAIVLILVWFGGIGFVESVKNLCQLAYLGYVSIFYQSLL